MCKLIRGFIYIASAFESLTPSGCVADDQVDNDPHLWTKPYTWGICRYDIRNRIKEGDYIFFVLGRNANLPQMIFAYIKVGEIINHYQAYHREELKSKRMTDDKKIQGNILVDSEGKYNIHDKGIHKATFDKRKWRYVIADMDNSRFLSKVEIINKSKGFVHILNKILYKHGQTPFEIITRAGQRLTQEQTLQLLEWLNQDQNQNSIKWTHTS